MTFRGVRIGSVARIGVNINLKDLSARVPVCMELNPSDVKLPGYAANDSKRIYWRRLLAGLEARLGMQGLVTGQLRVDLDLEPKAHATDRGGNLFEFGETGRRAVTSN